jgi:hypothetical protein
MGATDSQQSGIASPTTTDCQFIPSATRLLVEEGTSLKLEEETSRPAPTDAIKLATVIIIGDAVSRASSADTEATFIRSRVARSKGVRPYRSLATRRSD